LQTDFLSALAVELGAIEQKGAKASKAYIPLLHAAHNSRASESQVDMLSRLDRAGVITAVAVGVDNAIRQLEDWSLLRGRAS
jgi:hypothetical protein